MYHSRTDTLGHVNLDPHGDPNYPPHMTSGSAYTPYRATSTDPNAPPRLRLGLECGSKMNEHGPHQHFPKGELITNAAAHAEEAEGRHSHMATYGPRGNLGVKDPLRRPSELSKLPEEPGIPCFHIRPVTEDNISTTSTSPVVLVAGPGPDGKLVIKPPEGTWIITNPRLAGLHWKQFKQQP